MKISIVIVTRNRARLLFETLVSLAKQTLDHSHFEVIIVDHSSTDSTLQVVENFHASLNIKLVHAPYSGHSISLPRNLGWSHAKSDVVMFLDCGLVINSEHLHNCTRFFDHGSTTMRLGIGLCYGLHREDDWLDKGIDTTDLATTVAQRDEDPSIRDPRSNLDLKGLQLPWLYFWGGHAVVPRRLLREVGGFEESLCGWGFEDLELGYRLIQSGATLSIVPGAHAVHLPHPRTKENDRLLQALANWRYSFAKHRTIELEAFGAASMDLTGSEQAYHDIRETILRHEADAPPSAELNTIHKLLEQTGSDQQILLIGCHSKWLGTNIVTRFNGMTVPFWGLCSTEPSPSFTYLPILGVQLPFESQKFDRIIVSTIWQYLHKSPGEGLAPYTRMMIRDFSRVGREICFLYRGSLPASMSELHKMIVLEAADDVVSIRPIAVGI